MTDKDKNDIVKYFTQFDFTIKELAEDFNYFIDEIETTLAESGVNIKPELTPGIVTEIKELFKSGMMQHNIAKKFNISRGYVSNIITGKRLL